MPNSRSQQVLLANRFELLQTLGDNEVRHGIRYGGLAPVVTEKLSFKGNKNGNGQNWGTVLQDISTKALDMDYLESTLEGNKNKTCHSWGQSNSDNCHSHQASDFKVQHELNYHSMHFVLSWGIKTEQGPNWVSYSII